MSSQIDAVKQAIDIVALISERVKLTRAGKNYKGLCPFHSEKSPSFFVTPELGRYKCFGCQESGDAFTFLEKMDGFTFAQALQELAKRAGITLDSVPFTAEDKKREQILSLLSLTKEFYHYLLVDHPIGEPARAYLQERGVKAATIELFGLGFAPPAWNELEKYLIHKKGYTEQELIDSGVLIKNERGKTYDRFRNRLMFPLTTHRGQVVGFSGRTLEKDVKEAKYINTPETSVYHKSELLFGYSQMSSFIRKANEIIVCEGEFDVISSIQAGVSNVSAIKGSALTALHVKFLSHMVKRVILALDADSAGIEATKRAISVINESGADISLRVIPLIGGKDPDDIARENPDSWRKMVEKSVSVYEYLIANAFLQFDAKTGDGKREISRTLSPMIASIENAVERAHYVTEVAKKLGVSEDVFLGELRKIKLPAVPKENNRETKREVALAQSREDVIERYTILLLLAAIATENQGSREWIEYVYSHFSFHKPWMILFDAVYNERFSLDIAEISKRLPQELQELLTQLYMEASESAPEFLSTVEFEKAATQHTEIGSKQLRKVQIKRLTELELKENLTEIESSELAKLRSSIAP
ncbi:MAG: DNA primase [Candidatus Woesebacteria bacterium]